MATPSTHPWRFSRTGGFDQPRLETAADLHHLGELDQKLWTALSCPVKGLEFDERTLALIDTDKDGRVRAPEILQAVRWCDAHLADLTVLQAGRDSVPLAQINERTEEGRVVLASARQILQDLGKEGATEITLADVSDTKAIFSQTRFNGDGVIPVDAAEDEATKKAIEDVIACLGSSPDRSGKVGIHQEELDLFFKQLGEIHEWYAVAESSAAIRPLGEATDAAADAWRAVRAKVDDWFARCRLAAFDPRSLAAVNRIEEEYIAIGAKEISANAQEVAGFPLARVEPGRALPLTAGLNPAWAGAVALLHAKLVAPLLGVGRTTLTEAEWNDLGARLAAHETWLAGRPATAVEKLGLPRVREILLGPSKGVITELIARDKALEPQAKSVVEVERLVRYHRDLFRLLNNFVNFSDFYSPDRHAVFQVGTLYLDARSCELCVRVDDPGKHAALAGFSKAYLVYCDCTRPTGEKMTIAAAFTDGDSDFLMVGRNGVLYDRKGLDWDATITKVVENPISVRQAFWSPYKKLVRIVEEFAAKRAAAREATSHEQMTGAAQAAVHADEAKPEPKKMDIGTVAAISVAFGAIGTLIVTLLGYSAGLFKLPFWQLCLAFVGILLVISGPSMFIAWLKLRQRNLAPILDANGWAVNGRVRMNVKFGRSLTGTAQLPPGHLPASADPFGERPSVWPKLVLAVVAIWFVCSLLNWKGWIFEWTKEGTWFHQRAGFSLGDRRLTEAEEAEIRAKEEARIKAASAPPAVADKPAETPPKTETPAPPATPEKGK